MNKEIKKIVKSLRKIDLSGEEKRRLRSEFIREAGIKAPATKSPFQWTIFICARKRELVAVLASFAVIIVTGSSLSFAAEKSLPGDLLYPIKKTLNEPTAKLFNQTFGGKEKTEVEIELVDKRLEEAEELEENDDLEGPTLKKVRTEIMNQTKKAEESVEAEKKKILEKLNREEVDENENDDEEDNKDHSSETYGRGLTGKSTGGVDDDEKPEINEVREKAFERLKKVLDDHKNIIDKLDL